MNSTNKDQIFCFQSSPQHDEIEESSCSERVYSYEDKGSLPNDSRRGFDFRVKNNTNCCYLCSKKFPTIKSLCGHMRSHPEREWRGIQPPLYRNDDVVVASSCSNSSSSADVDVASVDLSASLCWGWSTTAKRGRKSLSSSSRIREVEQHHMLQEEGVYELMLLAGVLQCEAKKDSFESSRKSTKSITSDNGSRVGIDIENRNMNPKKKKKGTKRMKLNEIGMNKLDVVICNESFQCYQSHEHDHHGNITRNMEAFNGTKSSLEEAKSSQQKTSLVEKSPKILSFDLNMPPTMDEEQKGIQSEIIIPYYASSFQNSVTKL